MKSRAGRIFLAAVPSPSSLLSPRHRRTPLTDVVLLAVAVDAALGGCCSARTNAEACSTGRYRHEVGRRRMKLEEASKTREDTTDVRRMQCMQLR
mmetsp:Transcript_18224/g.43147  ORF Transcript_18224/g.43147 Transcript_18224/m.43147 type:complete len:95 (-) Transcript_18224:65-349(-)